MLKCLWAVGLFTVAVSAATPSVTFHKDVLPVLQKNCQGCHRPGEAAPSSFLTYKETRPWAKAIRAAVLTGKMPPWYADPHIGKFENDRSLSKSDIDTLVKWSDSGAPEGNPADAPKPLQFTEGWNIGTPDAVYTMGKPYTVPAKGTIEYTYFIVPLNFTEDRWVDMAEIRAGNRSVVHHVIAFIRSPENKWLRAAPVNEAYVPPLLKDKDGKEVRENVFGGEWLTVYAPGTVPDQLKPGQARLIKAGSDLVIQMHYTANGKQQQDLTKVGIKFAKQPPRERVVTIGASNGNFVIPPGDPNHRVDASATLDKDAKIVAFFPHMHLRGKSFSYRAVFPDGRTQDLLSVPKYDFNWQLSYLPAEQTLLPAGTRIECVAHFDNSPNNPANPDPKSEVRFGEQSWEEMMIGFFDVAVDPQYGPNDMLRRNRRRSD